MHRKTFVAQECEKLKLKQECAVSPELREELGYVRYMLENFNLCERKENRISTQSEAVASR